MSFYDYQMSREISGQDYPFYGLLMALIRQADDQNLYKIKMMWPEVVNEFRARYNAPGGRLPEDEEKNHVQCEPQTDVPPRPDDSSGATEEIDGASGSGGDHL